MWIEEGAIALDVMVVSLEETARKVLRSKARGDARGRSQGKRIK